MRSEPSEPRALHDAQHWLERVPRLSPALQYTAAIAAAVLAVALRRMLDPVWGDKYPFILFFPAIALSAWLGGLRPGLLTTLLCFAAAEYFWIPPFGSWAVDNPSDVVALLVLSMVGVLISGLNEAWRRGAEKVMQSKERLRVTLTSIGDAVITTDQDGRVVHLNAVAQSLTGWSQADARGRRLEDVFVIINEETRRTAENPVQKVLAEGVTANLANHTLLIAKDGREIPVEDSAAPIRSGNGSLVGAILVFRDITQRRQGERERSALLERERLSRVQAEVAASQLHTALEAGRMGTWEYRLKTGQVTWSPGLEQIHGYAPGTFPATFDAFRSEIHEEDRERVLQAIGEAIEQGRDHHIEYRIVRRDATVRWVEGVGQLFRDADGRPERMVGVCTDVTERRRADEQVRLAVEASPAAMVMVDSDGRVIFVNAMTAHLLGYTQQEMIGMAVEDLVPERFRSGHRGFREAFYGNRQSRPMGAGRDLFALRKDGTEVPVEIGLTPIETADGAVIVAAVTDITERKRVESALRDAKTAAEEANRMKDAFLATLSHELRTPLQSIVTYVYLLRSEKLSRERSLEALDAVQRNAQIQTRLIESLLDLSRIEAGKLDLRMEQVDLLKVVSAAVDVVRPDAETKRQTIEVTAAQSLGTIGDAARLQQVVWNLLSNAVKFTPPEGRIEIRLQQNDSSAQLRVSDNGQGIDPAFLSRAFERFSQEDRTQVQAGRGLGLGLAIVRELVKAHGGSVAAESLGEGQGSSFTVTLPLRDAASTLSTPGG